MSKNLQATGTHSCVDSTPQRLQNAKPTADLPGYDPRTEGGPVSTCYAMGQ